jgi:hypothetical protein
MEFAHVVVSLGDEIGIIDGKGSMDADYGWAEITGHKVLRRCRTPSEAEFVKNWHVRHIGGLIITDESIRV